MGLVIWDALTLVKTMFFVVVLGREDGWGAPQKGRIEFDVMRIELERQTRTGEIDGDIVAGHEQRGGLDGQVIREVK